MKKSIALVLALVIAGAAFFAAQGGARANGTTCTAFIGGLKSDKTGSPELVVFNTTNSAMPLDLTLRAPDGTVLTTRAGALNLGPRATGTVDLKLELAHAGANGKAYSGVFTAEVSGASPFVESAAIVHVTQYFGSIKKPKAGFVVRALFSPGP